MDEQGREYTRKASFEEYRLLLINELERMAKELRLLSDKVEQFRRQDVAEMKTDIALLKLQATIYGAIAGLVSTGIITAIIKFIHV